MPLLHFLFREFNGELLLLSLAQDSKRHFRSFGKSLQELSQLTRLDQNLEDVVLLNASSSSGAIRFYIIDNQPEAFRQAKLVAHNSWHLRCVYTEVGDGNSGPFFIMTWHSRRMRRTRWLWRLWRRRRCLCECCDRQ